jgi:hypothetical protein
MVASVRADRGKHAWRQPNSQTELRIKPLLPRETHRSAFMIGFSPLRWCRGGCRHCRAAAGEPLLCRLRSPASHNESSLQASAY